MALKLRVKLGNVSNLSDARYAAGMGVEAVGFDVTHTSSVTSEQMNEITNWISGVEIVGETGTNGSPAPGYNFDVLETSNPSRLSSEHPGILKIDISDVNFEEIPYLINKHGHQIKYLIIKLAAEQIAQLASSLRNIAEKIDLFLSSDIKPEMLDQIINEIRPAGIELIGGVEDKPGFKDYDELADVLEALELD